MSEDDAYMVRTAERYTSNNKLAFDPAFQELAMERYSWARRSHVGPEWGSAVERMKAYARLLGEKM